MPQHKSPDAARVRGRAWRASALLATLLLLPCFAASSLAGEVYGTVKVDSAMFQGSLTLTHDGRTIPIRDGRYRIFLAPGTYDVIFSDGQRQWREQIQSYPGPIRQDIDLSRR